MTTDILTKPQPAHTNPNSTPTTPTTDRRDRGEVKAVALMESRRARVKRAWDEMSETDRLVLLEAARQRRQIQAARDAREVALFAKRAQH